MLLFVPVPRNCLYLYYQFLVTAYICIFLVKRNRFYDHELILDVIRETNVSVLCIEWLSIYVPVASKRKYWKCISQSQKKMDTKQNLSR